MFVPADSITVQASHDYPAHALVSIGHAVTYVSAAEAPVLARALYRATGLPFPGIHAAAETTITDKIADAVGSLGEDWRLKENPEAERIGDMLEQLAFRIRDGA